MWNLDDIQLHESDKDLLGNYRSKYFVNLKSPRLIYDKKSSYIHTKLDDGTTNDPMFIVYLGMAHESTIYSLKTIGYLNVLSKIGGLAAAGARGSLLVLYCLCYITYNIKVIRIVIFGEGNVGEPYVE